MTNTARSTGASVVGMGWYRSEDWERLLQVISDRDEMYDSYAEWLAEAQRAERAAAAEGIQVKRVPVDPDELGSIRNFVCLGRAVDPVQAIARVKRSPKRMANCALAMHHSRAGMVHSFSDRFKTRNSSFRAASSVGK